jgi:23S rRNA (uracil1939-C5)-methyltransferase
MVGQVFPVKIEKLVMGGDGLAHVPDGRVLFVPFSLPEERLKVRIVQQKKDYVVGTVEDILEPSPNRVQPHCPHYGVCGGCSLQHVSYECEIGLKGEFLAEILTRQAKVEIEPEAVYPCAQEWGYRTKSEHPVASHEPAPLIGYYRRRTHEVIDINQCPVLAPSSLEDIAKLRKILGSSGESCYNERAGKGNLRHVILRRSSQGKRLIGLVTRTGELAGETLKGLLEEFTDLAGIVHNVNPEPGSRILGKRTEVVSGAGHLTEEIGGLKLRVSFTSFFQANHAQAERIVALVADFLQPESGDVLCDAYAGVGMIGLGLARDVKEVVAIESASSSVQDGICNAEINDLDNVRWIKGDASAVLREVEYNTIVLDPPRKGLTEGVISAVVDARPHRVCYVSCNPSTWARDITSLKGMGYSLKRLAWLDMFPKTAHMELVSLLETT